MHTPFQHVLLSLISLTGDEWATREYCGNYVLSQDEQGRLFRCDSHRVPSTHTVIVNAYDEDGLLLPEYWALPRILAGSK